MNMRFVVQKWERNGRGKGWGVGTGTTFSYKHDFLFYFIFLKLIKDRLYKKRRVTIDILFQPSLCEPRHKTFNDDYYYLFILFCFDGG